MKLYENEGNTSVRNAVAQVDTLDINNNDNIFLMLAKVHKLEGRNIPKLITTCLTVQQPSHRSVIAAYCNPLPPTQTLPLINSTSAV